MEQFSGTAGNRNTRLCNRYVRVFVIVVFFASFAFGYSTTNVVFVQDVEITENGVGVGQVYAGTHDAELRKAAPNTNYDEGTGSSDPEFKVDELGNLAESHVVLRFDDIFDHVPTNATVLSATLFIDEDDYGNNISLYRLAEGVSAWAETTVTWNNLGFGTNGVGVGTDTTGSATIINGSGNKVYIDVTADVEAWHGGAVNNGWAFLPGGTDDVDFDASENSDSADRPSLTIEYTVLPPGAPPPAQTDHYRVTWDDDPGSTATIAWKQISGANGTVYYGTTDFGRSWSNYPSQKTVDKVGTFTLDGTINTCFARLTGLQPDTPYYFVIKDDAGVSPRFWFLTAPDTPKPFTFIGGGDSRSNPTPRRRANRMVARLRPLFVYFTGDMISNNTAAEWNEWFEHWQESISGDGRIYPLIPHRGNQEGYNASDNAPFFELFDTTSENYYSFSVGGNLMRFYVLNSEMDDNTTKWNAQTSWLTNDLVANAASHTHLAAGYHKPMRPHTSGKSEGNNEYSAWAVPFYSHGMDLVFEADSHTVKRTWPVRPDAGAGSTEGFIRDDANGTVYSGEGCWGAPLRSPDDIKPWTRDVGQFNSFDWVHVYPSYMELYTIQVDNADSVGWLKEGDVFSLPSNIGLWEPANGARVIINNHAGASTNSYAQWQLGQWGAEGIPADTEALSDFDGDGYNNLTEFAYGLDPKVAAPPGEGVFPVINVESSDIEVSYRRTPNTSLTYSYDFSSDLITWTPMTNDVDYSQIAVPADENEQVTIDLLGSKEAAVQGFIRVRTGIR